MSVLLQFLLLLAVSFIVIFATIDLTSDLEKISAPLNDVDVSALSSGSEENLLRQVGLMYAGYVSLMKHMVTYTLLLLLSFLVLEGSMIVLSGHFVKKKWAKGDWKEFFVQLKRFCERTLLFVLPYVLVFVLLMTQLVELVESRFFQGIAFLLLLFLFILYHVYVSACYLDVSSWKKYFRVLRKKVYSSDSWYILGFILVFGLCLLGLGYLFYYVVNMLESYLLFWVLLILLLLFVCYFRWYFVSLVRGKIK